MQRISFICCLVSISGCLIPVDAGSDGCTPGFNETCAESSVDGVIAGVCLANETCLCNTGFVRASSGRCMRGSSGGGSAGTGGGGAQSQGGGAQGPGGGPGSTGGGAFGTDGGDVVRTDGGFVRTDGGVVPGGPRAPAVMLLLDVSGSMLTAFSQSYRGDAMRKGLDGFLLAHSNSVRFAATTFPASTPMGVPAGCGSPSNVAVDFPIGGSDAPTALEAHTQTVRSFVSTLGGTTRFTGGIPTAGALRFVATVPGLADVTRARGVILVTDGLPNCNPMNPISCTVTPRPADQLCTLGSTNGASNCSGQYCAAGYLDQPATISAISTLRAAGIPTAIVFIDSTTASTEVQKVLNEMADIGGTTACPGASCTERYFWASSEAEVLSGLTAALKQVAP